MPTELVQVVENPVEPARARSPDARRRGGAAVATVVGHVHGVPAPMSASANRT